MNHTKKCPVCQVEKDISCFAFKNKSLGKLHSRCRKCQAIYHKEHYELNKQKYLDKSKRNNEKYKEINKAYIQKYKSNHGCVFCKESDPCCLDFHHINPENKKKDIASMQHFAHSLDTIKTEIKKCIVVCANCHRKLHAGVIEVGHVGIEPTT